MNITAAMVKELRDITGAGMMDCKKALADFDGDMEKAMDSLKEKGFKQAEKKADRVAAEGLVEAYIHGEGRIGVLVEINTETDFVAKTADFKELCHDIAMQIAATSPLFVSRNEVSEDEINSQKELFRAQAIEEGKAEKFIDKIVDGKVEKHLKEVCLMEQPYIKDPDMTVHDLVVGKIAKIGENISIRRFARFQVGEGLEKRSDDLAAEVAAINRQNLGL